MRITPTQEQINYLISIGISSGTISQISRPTVNTSTKSSSVVPQESVKLSSVVLQEHKKEWRIVKSLKTWFHKVKNGIYDAFTKLWR